jgi:hypothetical protein
MTLCHVCQHRIPGGAGHCIACGAAPTAFSVVEQAGYQATRRQDRRRSYALTAALLVAGMLLVAGFPGSLWPTNLAVIAVMALGLGGPLGWLVSAAGGGLVSGALIGGSFGILFAVLAALTGDGATVGAALFGLAQGLVPGLVVGWQVEHDA